MNMQVSILVMISKLKMIGLFEMLESSQCTKFQINIDIIKISNELQQGIQL